MIRKLLFLLLVLCGIVQTGCSTAKFEMEEKQAGQIVYYLAEHEGKTDEPVFILCHGLCGNHKDMESAAENLYNRGYAVVVFDLYGHGASVYDSDIYIHEMLEESKNRLEKILDSLKKEDVCNADKFGIYGTSLGGMTAFYEGAFGNKTPQLIISIASTPDIKDIFEKALDCVPSKRYAGTESFTYVTEKEKKALIQWAEMHNPIDEIDRLSKIPIVMVNGTADQYMDIRKVRLFREEVEKRDGIIYVYENINGNHEDIGDFHSEEILENLKEIFPVVLQ